VIPVSRDHQRAPASRLKVAPTELLGHLGGLTGVRQGLAKRFSRGSKQGRSARRHRQTASGAAICQADSWGTLAAGHCPSWLLPPLPNPAGIGQHLGLSRRIGASERFPLKVRK